MMLERVRIGSDSDWVLIRLAIGTPVSTALGTDKIKNLVAIARGSESARKQSYTVNHQPFKLVR